MKVFSLESFHYTVLPNAQLVQYLSIHEGRVNLLRPYLRLYRNMNY